MFHLNENKDTKWGIPYVGESDYDLRPEFNTVPPLTNACVYVWSSNVIMQKLVCTHKHMQDISLIRKYATLQHHL